jgi:hypothetical protein
VDLVPRLRLHLREREVDVFMGRIVGKISHRARPGLHDPCRAWCGLCEAADGRERDSAPRASPSVGSGVKTPCATRKQDGGAHPRREGTSQEIA